MMHATQEAVQPQAWHATSRGGVPDPWPEPGLELLKATLNVSSVALGMEFLKDLMHLAVCAPQHPLYTQLGIPLLQVPLLASAPRCVGPKHTALATHMQRAVNSLHA